MFGETSHVSELSPSTPAPADAFSTTDTHRSPERAHLVTAIGAILVDDPLGAAVALQAALDASSWDSVGHRIEVAIRALTIDADLEPWRGPRSESDFAATDDVDERWASLWSDTHSVANLVARAGYPPEVLA